MIISIDGEVVSPERATISVLDRGLLYGDGLFEVLRTWNGVAIDLDAHLARLHAAANDLQLRVPPIAIPPLPPGESRIRIVVTRGPGPLSARLADLAGGHAIVIVEPLPPQPSELSVATVPWTMPRVGMKRLAYVDHVIARELAAAAGADEALPVDERGIVAECATANLFVVAGDDIATPPVALGILPGIVRAHVMALAAVEERVLTLDDVARADEVFVTSSLRGVVPVTRIDGQPRRAGPITRRLARAYIDAMNARAL